MNIVMMTNTYHPIVGGLEKSVEVFSSEYRGRGHNVLIVAPESEGVPKHEEGVFRVPAIKNISDTDFSIELPISTDLNHTLKQFQPDIIHTHHPFLIGDTALRAATRFNIPIVFTNHTLYAKNTHYLPAGDSQAVKKFVVELAKGYANLCDQVIAPSQSVAELLKSHNVRTPIEVLPTGIYVDNFKEGDGRTFRRFFDIPLDAFVIGIIGRVAPEKNVIFLAESVAAFMKDHDDAYFVVVGSGPSLGELQEVFKKHDLSERLVCTGVLRNRQLVSAYTGLDVFAFASQSETQGLVLAESMAAGTPVVGVDAPGVRDIIEDRKNGCLVQEEDTDQFVAALRWLTSQSPQKRGALARNAKKTAELYDVQRCVDGALKLYDRVLETRPKNSSVEDSPWHRTLNKLETQAKLLRNFMHASATAFIDNQ